METIAVMISWKPAATVMSNGQALWAWALWVVTEWSLGNPDAELLRSGTTGAQMSFV